MGWFTDAWGVGKRVQHSDGEKGTIVSIEQMGNEEMAKVYWDDTVTTLVHEDEVVATD